MVAVFSSYPKIWHSYDAVNSTVKNESTNVPSVLASGGVERTPDSTFVGEPSNLIPSEAFDESWT
jgi:hypothetical protein